MNKGVQIAAVTLGMLTFAGASGGGSFVYGQSTRLSDEQVQAKLATQVAEAKEHERQAAERTLTRELKKQEKALRKEFRHDRAAAVRKAKDFAEDKGREQGYASGSAAGHAAGEAEGEAEGYQEGAAEGYQEGVIDGIDSARPEPCSDDPDVPLPYCNSPW